MYCTLLPVRIRKYGKGKVGFLGSPSSFHEFSFLLPASMLIEQRWKEEEERGGGGAQKNSQNQPLVYTAGTPPRGTDSHTDVPRKKKEVKRKRGLKEKPSV